MADTINEIIPDNDQTRARREHLEAIRALVGNAYPNKFRRTNVTNPPEGEDTISSVVAAFKHHEPQVAEGVKPSPEQLEAANAELNGVEVRVSGRLATPPRVMGKVAFVHLSDGKSRLQIYVRRDETVAVSNDTSEPLADVEHGGWKLFQLLDHGDFVGVSGFLFVTKTGELSVHVRELPFLSKALVPMPDKVHGISDPEIGRRQRYVDLIAASLRVKTGEEGEEERQAEHREYNTREVFELRSKLITNLRAYLDTHGYVEVETPMLTPVASGAAARPFETFHNALGIKLYARIAPELYLKRLLVGGFERVYEINRNFRNEGISNRHNPEFTMLEFYCAYMDVEGMMDFCEIQLRTIIQTVCGSLLIPYGTFTQIPSGQKRPEFIIDFSKPFKRLSMKQAIAKYWRADTKNAYLSELDLNGEEFNVSWLDDPSRLRLLVNFISKREDYRWKAASELIAEGLLSEEEAEEADEDHDMINLESWKLAVIDYENNQEPLTKEEMAEYVAYLFEVLAEPHLKQPTYIYNFPKAISPLSKASPADPSIAERFELYVAGMEVANGFSELNDPVEQYERFEDQARQRERGDDEAMQMDTDYVRALSYGMPPAAGIGIGIDRLVMLLTNRKSIRDVILFPHMRPVKQSDEAEQSEDPEKT